MRIFILASGPSLDGFNLRKLDNETTLGINYICRYYKPTVLLFGDLEVYTSHKDIIDAMDCIKVTKDTNPGLPGVYRVPISQTFNGEEGLSKGLYTDFLTGFMAISLAIALGFDEIYLLGYDGKFKDGQGHFYSKDFRHRGDGKENIFISSINMYKPFADWYGIYNCSPISAIPYFPKIDIDKVLKVKYPVDKPVIMADIKAKLSSPVKGKTETKPYWKIPATILQQVPETEKAK